MKILEYYFVKFNLTLLKYKKTSKIRVYNRIKEVILF